MFENLQFGDQPIINYGTNETPLFKACEIGKILDIKNIRMSLKNFDDDEKIYKKFSRSIYTYKEIKKGDIINKKNIKIVRPGFGVLPKYYDKLIGKSSPINIKKNLPIKKNFLKKLKVI